MITCDSKVLIAVLASVFVTATLASVFIVSLMRRVSAYRRAHGRYRTMLAEANFHISTPTKWHDLRCHPSDFEHIHRGIMSFYVVANDRDFMPGDGIRLREYAFTRNEYTGRVVCIYILGAWSSLIGVKDRYCVMSIRIIAPPLD